MFYPVGWIVYLTTDDLQMLGSLNKSGFDIQKSGQYVTSNLPQLFPRETSGSKTIKKKINQEVSMFMVPSGFAIIPVPTILSVLKMGCADNAPILRMGWAELVWQCSFRIIFNEQNQQNMFGNDLVFIICSQPD